MNEKISREEEWSMLVDIRDIKIDKSLCKEERIESFMRQIKNPYKYKFKHSIVSISFNKEGRKLEDIYLDLINNK